MMLNEFNGLDIITVKGAQKGFKLMLSEDKSRLISLGSDNSNAGEYELSLAESLADNWIFHRNEFPPKKKMTKIYQISISPKSDDCYSLYPKLFSSIEKFYEYTDTTIDDYYWEPVLTNPIEVWNGDYET